MTTEPTTLTVGVLSERSTHERRVALDPSSVARLVASGHTVLVEAGSGFDASFADAAYTEAGASVVSRARVIDDCTVLTTLGFPDESVTTKLVAGQAVVGLLDTLSHLDEVATLAARGVALVALELLPRTISRAQSMDALSSQSSAAGYRAALIAASEYQRYLPMMVTAAGTAKPARVIVIGTGVAGLQAIATTKRLGAVVTGYDIRAASRGEVESLGARFLTSSVAAASDDAGYARPMTPEEQTIQKKELADALTGFDIIITTAKVPGRTPPLLVDAETLASLQPGTVCVDLGSSDKGGNVFGSVDGSTTTTTEGVIVVGGGNLASDLPASASQMYGRNLTAVLESLAPNGAIVIEPADDVHSAIVVSYDGTVTSAAVRSAMKLDPLPSSDAGGEPDTKAQDS